MQNDKKKSWWRNRSPHDPEQQNPQNPQDKVSKEAEVAAVFERLPWLGDNFRISGVSSVRFVPLTAEIMYNTAGRAKTISYLPTHARGVIDMERLIFLFNRAGKMIGQVGAVKTPRLGKSLLKTLGLVFARTIKNESVGEAVQRAADNTHYIVGLLPNDDDSRHRYSMLITMPPEGTDISRCLAAEMDRARVLMSNKLRASFSPLIKKDKPPTQV